MDNYRFNMVSTHGHFAIHGVPPDGEMPVVFLDAANDEGKYETFPGADAAQSKKFTLEKCGSATVRFIDPDGKPIAGKPQAVLIELADQRTGVGIAPPGYKSGPTFANWEVDFEKYQNQNRWTDDTGRLS